MLVFTDLDQVLSNFVAGWAVIARGFGVQLPDNVAEIVFSHKTYWLENEYGIPDAVNKKIWQRIIEMPNFWSELPMLSTVTEEMRDKLRLVSVLHDLFFVTHRVAKTVNDVYRQTRMWVKRNLEIRCTVLVAADKSAVVKALGGDVIIEDKPETLKELVKLDCKVFAPACRYNREIDGVDYSGLAGFLDYSLIRGENIGSGRKTIGVVSPREELDAV